MDAGAGYGAAVASLDEEARGYEDLLSRLDGYDDMDAVERCDLLLDFAERCDAVGDSTAGYAVLGMLESFDDTGVAPGADDVRQALGLWPEGYGDRVAALMDSRSLESVDQISLESLELPAGVYNVMKQARLDYAGQVSALSDDALLGIRGFPPDALGTVRERLSELTAYQETLDEAAAYSADVAANYAALAPHALDWRADPDFGNDAVLAAFRDVATYPATFNPEVDGSWERRALHAERLQLLAASLDGEHAYSEVAEAAHFARDVGVPYERALSGRC